MKGNIDNSPVESLPSKSTGQADYREVCIINMTGAISEDNTWKECELQNQFEGLLSLLSKQTQGSLAIDTKSHHSSVGASTQSNPTQKETQAADHEATTEKLEIQDKSISQEKEDGIRTLLDDNKIEHTVEQTMLPVSISCAPYLVTETIKKYEEYLEKCKRSTNVTKLHMLFNIVDVGGQPAFLDMLPSLTIGPALYLLFSKLVDDNDQVLGIHHLTTKQTVKYRTEQDEGPQDCQEYFYTLQEVLFSALSSIACFGLSDKDVENYVTKTSEGKKATLTSSLAILLGTHEDKINESNSSSLDNTESELKKILEQTDFCKRNLIGFPKEENKVFFRVNNLLGGEDEIPKYKLILQQLVEENFRQYDIPASWLGLSICMKILANEKNAHTVAFEDCVQLGDQHFKMNRGMIEVALKFLHKYTGLVLYFPENPLLKDLVICNPQVIFSSVSELIFNVYESTSRKELLVETKSAEQKTFERTGKFSLDTVKYVENNNIGQLLPLQKLVDLLVHLNIAAAIPQDTPLQTSVQSPDSNQSLPNESTVYFLPAVLKTMDLSSIKSEIQRARSEEEDLLPEPLYIQFQTGFLPMGFACALIAKLLGVKKFTLAPDESVLHKNKIKFRFDGEFNVIIISSPLYCEFVVTHCARTRKFHENDCCPKILEKVRKAADFVLQSMKRSLLSETDYDFAFKCPKCTHPENQFGRETLAKIIYSDKSRSKLKQLECQKCRTTTIDVKQEMEIWFGEVSRGEYYTQIHIKQVTKHIIQCTAVSNGKKNRPKARETYAVIHKITECIDSISRFMGS